MRHLPIQKRRQAFLISLELNYKKSYGTVAKAAVFYCIKKLKKSKEKCTHIQMQLSPLFSENEFDIVKTMNHAKGYGYEKMDQKYE